MNHRWLVPGAFLLAALACDTGAGERGGDRGFHGTLLPEPGAKAEFTLTDTEGRPFAFHERTDGHVTLLFFGYTHCPDVCPVTMSNLGAAYRRLSPGVRDRIKVVFVSTDPERDTPERIGSWLANFHRDFIGLRGELDEVNDIMASFALPPAMREGSGEDYTVGHSARVLAFTADDRLRLMYPADTRQAEWVSDLSRLVRNGVPSR